MALALSQRSARADDPDSTENEPRTLRNQTWAIGMMVRTATIPFATSDRTVSSLVPLIFYQGRTVYFTGVSGGVHLLLKPEWSVSAIARMRFFDIPQSYQNRVQADAFLFGGQAEYKPYGPWYLDLELLSDRLGNTLGNVRIGTKWESPRWRIDGFAELQPKSSAFNSRYFGLDSVAVRAGSELGVGFFADYQVWSSLFAYAAGTLSRLDNGVRDVPFVNRDFNSSLYVGVGLSESPAHPTGPFLAPGSYLRVGYGWFTPASLGQTLKGQAERDTANNQMISFFYGHPLSKSLFTLPIDTYLHSGYVYHRPSRVQGPLHELVISIKIYYTIPIAWRIKLGAAEGLSWINEPSFVEGTRLGTKGYIASNLANYLDFTADLNTGDIIHNETLKSWWIGAGVHHRSSIFELAQQFGRIRGGSNIKTLYLTKSF